MRNQWKLPRMSNAYEFGGEEALGISDSFQRFEVVPSLKERDFADVFLEMTEGNKELLARFWMSDKAHFYLSGFVNKLTLKNSPFGQGYCSVYTVFDESHRPIFV